MNQKSEKQIEIRPITSLAEMNEVEELQKEVWGIPDIEVVPYSHLIAAVVAGGSLLGAFDGGEMVGFAYGFGGFEKGQHAHHSHMLAVKTGYRNYRLGERLKRAQREFVLQQGVTIMSWTFDPLQSLNAYFNFNKLGVSSDQYFVDFYGDEAPSFLHRNSTDRLWVIWDLKNETPRPPADPESFRRLVRLGRGDTPELGDLEEIKEDRVGIEIPNDINSLQSERFALAVEWRLATRTAFLKAFEQGFIASGFCRISRNEKPVGLYLLERKA